MICQNEQKTNCYYLVIIIIHEYLKAEKQFDTPNKPQIVRPRFTAILQKLKNKIQADSKLVKLYEFSVDL